MKGSRAAGRAEIQAAARRGEQAFEYRASVALAYRRLDRGEPVDRCAGCGCEVDVPVPAHCPRCRA